MAPRSPLFSLLSPSPNSPSSSPLLGELATPMIFLFVDHCVGAFDNTSAPCKRHFEPCALKPLVRSLAATFVKVASSSVQMQCWAEKFLETGTPFAQATPYRKLTSYDLRIIAAADEASEFSDRAAQAEVSATQRIAGARTAAEPVKVLPAKAEEDVKTWRHTDAALLHVVNKQLGRMAAPTKVLPTTAVVQGLGSRSQAAADRHVMRLKAARH